MKPDIIICVEHASWKKSLPQVEAFATKAARAAYDAGKKPAALKKNRVEVGIVLASDSTVKKLNALYRNKNKPTNVLSFPYMSKMGISDKKRTTLMLGDVFLAYQTIRREAKEQRKAFRAHLAHLIVHGVLHLLGYDHIRDSQAARMERLETRILKDLGFDDPYREA